MNSKYSQTTAVRFYVYCGYISSDRYDASEEPCYVLEEFSTKEEVEKFRKEFDENIHDECSNVFFRIIEGRERLMYPAERVIEWKVQD